MKRKMMVEYAKQRIAASIKEEDEDGGLGGDSMDQLTAMFYAL